MGGAQPLAITMNGGVGLIVEVDRWRAERRLSLRQVDAISDYIEALRDQIDELGGVPVEPFQVVESEARSMAVDV